jgi:carboxyl-terminal processing protease
MRQIVKLATTALVVVAIFVGGVFASRRDFGMGRNMEIMVNLMGAIATHYVDEVAPDEMMRNGAQGITSALDPYTTYLPEEEMNEFTTYTTGKYGGVGAVIRQDSDYVRIAEPYRGSPADLAGLQIGDRIVAIDGASTKGFTTSQVSNLLRGEPNTTVEVTVEKLLGGEHQTVKIRRQRIAIPSISYAGYVAEGIGYIRHSDFTDGCYDEMRAAIARLQSEGELKQLILDYRNNGGGVMQSAIKILSLFVPKGTLVVETKGRKAEDNTKYHTQNNPILPDIPLVVLINSNSASAAEIVAGALQDLDRALLLGERSFGKGLVQTTLPLGFNSYAKVTTAKYYIPSGRCIQAVRYNSEGRAEVMPDSLINEFRTAAGRKVYDGGGIMPDIKFSGEPSSEFTLTLYVLGLFDDFGDLYFQKHPTATIDPLSFSITDQEYEEFAKMVASRDIPYKSSSRTAFERLKKALEKERYDKGLEEAMAAIESGLHDDKMSNLQTYRKEVISYINSNIILRYAYSTGVTARSVSEDKSVKQAIEALGDKERMTKILREQDTERK